MLLDDLDRALLQLLREDSRRSYRTLAGHAGTTPPTAAARIRRMEEAGIIQGYTVRLDPEAFDPSDGDVDLEAAARVACHECGRRTEEPEWAEVSGRRHPFCCATCSRSFVARHRRLAQGL